MKIFYSGASSVRMAYQNMKSFSKTAPLELPKTTGTSVPSYYTSEQLNQKTLSSNAIHRAIFGRSSGQIWKSRLSWRIAAAVFMTILLVQTLILNFGTMPAYKERLIENLRESARGALAVTLDAKANVREVPLNETQAELLFNTTSIRGISIYSYETEFLRSFGSSAKIATVKMESMNRSSYVPETGTYETIYNAGDLKRPYYIAAKLSAADIQGEIGQFVMETITIMLFMSLFVTTVLMIALGYWLLEPMLFMRDNLLAAFRNPENPKIPDNPYDRRDEIGSAIDLAQKLIKQNSQNLTQMKSAAEDKIHKLAYYDTRTGLPNRTLFLQNLSEKAQQNQDGSVERFAVVTIDLDHFKDINDSMGHNVGDAILRGVAKRLRTALPDNAIVAKLGEDEYAILMQLSTDLNSARDVAESVHYVLRNEPFKVFNESFQVRASIGVSTFPDDGIEPDQVLKNADIALNRAKEEGRDRIKEYSEDFDIAVQARFQMLRDLRDAMEHQQLDLYYQPQLNLRTGKIIGAEALLRWYKPNNSKEGGTFISPGEFIPVAEQSGLIVPIGEWVTQTACEMARSWQLDHDLDIRIAVNVSAAQFSQSDICGFTQEVINNTGIDPHKLELEVTESVFMDDIQHTIQTLQNLHAIGVELAIDDFGTGYSSLSYLRQFPIDRLKIDQSFIRNALNNPDDASIARTIIALGRSLNLNVIAEGVETKEHEQFLLDEGCDEVQGFRYCRPIPAKDFIAFAKDYNGKLDYFDK